jgi:hypothetical protein
LAVRDDHDVQQGVKNRVHRRMRVRPPFVVALVIVAASLAGPLVVGAQATTFEFPSSSSTVVASGGSPAGTVGYFWSKARGDKVSQAFVGPSYIEHAALTVQPSTNSLLLGSEVDWTLSINGVDIGSFVVPPGTTSPIVFERSFTAMPGPNYAVEMRVTNEVGSGQGSISLPTTGGTGLHSLDLSNAGPPDTVLTSEPAAVTAATSATFTFSSSRTNVTGFQCSLDHTGFVPCVSPKSYDALAPGPHSFEVSAIDAMGSIDPSPAAWQWTVTAIKSTKSLKCKKGFKKARKHGKAVCIKKKHHKHKHQQH